MYGELPLIVRAEYGLENITQHSNRGYNLFPLLEFAFLSDIWKPFSGKQLESGLTYLTATLYHYPQNILAWNYSAYVS